MRSVVASHGPGSNPRGNAICNAILLQSFSVLQIFGLLYLDDDRSRELCGPWLPVTDLGPILGVMQYAMQSYYKAFRPKNLKFQNRTKPGPISHTGPKTPRAARDRPEPNPRRNQTSRHDIAGASPERRPAGGGSTNETHDDSVRDAAPRRRNAVRKSRAAVVRIASFQRRPVAPLRPAIVARRGATCIGSGRPPSRMERRNEARPARNSSASSSAQLCANLGRQCATLARGLAAVGQQPCATSAQAYRAAARALAHVHCGRYRQSGPRPEPRLLRQPALEALMNSARTDSPRRVGRKRISGDNGRWRRRRTTGGGGGFREEGRRRTLVSRVRFN
ncbi:hypothetical protein F511_40872 [Dorcoceras hygrometricum]|uniref:Uncharacterized protein n=1 Tax=Dorcoceras hygrometricum TaxID=472368 RepID=A0A2Z7C8D8_9LAMI|nr:hypothetical protein F511_40872 [Dorcoceras hygrometricum]